MSATIFFCYISIYTIPNFLGLDHWEQDYNTPVLVLHQLGDRVAEEVLDILAGGLVQHPRQIAALDLGVPVRADTIERLARNAGAGFAVRVDVGGAALARAQCVHRVEQAHAPHHLGSGAEHVDGLAALAQGRGLLHDRRG
ncbi:hypothetical protein [Nocardia wallacei]|uniref:hypothetical protein n=1 Tax=Nocardia wallacei TaxID=480035 RepID=UPI0024553DA8|nr:hypothetical protein [Nocardia wallacei]